MNKWDNKEEVQTVISLRAEEMTPPEIADALNKRFWKGEQVRSETGVIRFLERKHWSIEKCQSLITDKNKPRIIENKNSDDNKTVLEWLQKEELSVGEMSRRLDRSKESIIKILDDLKSKGYEVNLNKDSRQVKLEKELKREFETIKFKHLYKDTCKIALLGDTHLYSKYQQLTLLHTAYDIMEKEEIEFAIHAGDLGDGDGRLYTGQIYEQFVVGIDQMTEYVINNYPKTNKFKTYVVSGNHDLSFLKHSGFNFVKTVCKERDDMVYRGDIGAKFQVKNMIMEVLHPSGGGSYARSYRMQKIIEGLVGDILMQVKKNPQVPIPQIYLAGHLHIAMYLPYISFQAYAVPCFQAQTPYLKAKGLYPQIGFWIIEFFFNKDKNIGIAQNKYFDFSGEILEKDY